MLRNIEPGKQLRTACTTKNLALLRELFEKQLVTAEPATKQLSDYHSIRKEPAIVRCLLENHANPNAVPIRLVKSIDDLKLLQEFGYDVKSKAHVLLQNYADDQDALDWLLDQGVDINLTDIQRLDDGFPLYPGASDWSLHLLNNVAANADKELFDHLVTRGADPKRSLALHTVSRCQDPVRAVDMVIHLLERHGMDLHADNEDLRDFFHYSADSGTPLCNAIFYKNLPVVQELINRGADITKAGKSGPRPVFAAIGYCFFRSGFLPALKPLLEAGANAQEALSHAVTELNAEAAEICLEYGADPEPALKEARHNEQERLISEAKYPGDKYGKKREAEKKCRALMEVLKNATMQDLAVRSETQLLRV